MRRIVVVIFALMVTSGSVAAQTAGKEIFEGKGMCYSCHGKDGKGTPLAPDLTDAEWINIDRTLPAIVTLIEKGVPKPVKHPAPMPAMGGAKLNKQEIEAVATYVKELNDAAQAQTKPASPPAS